MNIPRNYCGICLHDIKHFYVVENVPIQSTCSPNPIITSSTLSFAQCPKCNTIQLDELIPLDILYAESHNITSVGNVWKKYFELFTERLQPLIENKNVLEIGCPSGKIALKMNNFQNYFIVDPNKNENIDFQQKNITFIQSFFDEKFKTDKKIDVIVHSHLFEHIYNPHLFLRTCSNILPENGEMFFGVPNMSNLLESNTWPFIGICFEHTIFLNEENISFLLKTHDFTIIDIIYYEKHSVLYHCKKISSKKEKLSCKFTDYKNNFMESLIIYKNFIDRCNTCIVTTNKPVYIFGAGYNSQILLAMGIIHEKLCGVLDNCKEKQDNYLYGYSLQVFSPSILKDVDAIVILKNGYYCEEITQQIYSINPNTEIIV